MSENQDKGSSKSTENLEKKLFSIVESMEFDEKTQTYKLPDNIPEELALAAKAEKRRRDLQSRLDKTRTEKIKLEAKTQELEKRVYKTLDLTPEQKEELEELKFEDPDKWRVKLNSYEEEARKSLKTQVDEVVSKTAAELEKEERAKVLKNFLSDNPEIDPDSLYNDIPVRLKTELETGEISFSEYLTKAKEFLKAGKTVDTRNPDLKNLGDASGHTNIPDSIIKEDFISSYKEEVF